MPSRTLFALLLVIGCLIADEGSTIAHDLAHVPHNRSGARCKELRVSTKVFGCNKHLCKARVLELKSNNGVVSRTIYSKSDGFMNVANVSVIYARKNATLNCICNDGNLKKIISSKTFQIKDLPTPVENSQSLVYYIGLNSYAMNVSFTRSEAFPNQSYRIASEVYIDGYSASDTINCSKRMDNGYLCPRLLPGNINLKHTVTYQVWSRNQLAECSSQNKSREISFLDMYGPPRMPSVYKKGSDLVKLKFSPAVNPDLWPKYQMKLCMDGKCKYDDDIGYLKTGRYKVKDLLPLTKYSIRVRYDNYIDGPSHWSKPVEFTTLSIVPNSKPQEVACIPNRENGKSGFIINWKPPKTSSKFNVEKYVITTTERNGDPSERLYVPKTESVYEYKLTTDAKMVSVRILACSNGGCASKSQTALSNCIRTEQVSSGPPKSKKTIMYAIFGVAGILALALIGFAVVLLRRYIARQGEYREKNNTSSRFDSTLEVSPRSYYANANGRSNCQYDNIDQQDVQESSLDSESGAVGGSDDTMDSYA